MAQPPGITLVLTPVALLAKGIGTARGIWLAGVYNRRRIAWTPALRAYFTRNFVRVLFDDKGDTRYVRKG
jgi:hypothetical protein